MRKLHWRLSIWIRPEVPMSTLQAAGQRAVALSSAGEPQKPALRHGADCRHGANRLKRNS
jgi:hypothetical protein